MFSSADTFASILKNVRLSSNESQELFDNVFSIGPSCQNMRYFVNSSVPLFVIMFISSYWSTVTSKKTRRKHMKVSNRSVSPSLELQNSDICSSSRSSKEAESHTASEESASEFDLISLREYVSCASFLEEKLLPITYIPFLDGWLSDYTI